MKSYLVIQVYLEIQLFKDRNEGFFGGGEGLIKNENLL